MPEKKVRIQPLSLIQVHLIHRLESYPDIYEMVQGLVTRNRVSTFLLPTPRSREHCHLLCSRIVSPYPEPKHCSTPPEDRTSKPICRHIPLLMTRQATSLTKTVVHPGIFSCLLLFLSISYGA